ncbi:MAG TPA: 2-amino-4-hydroxy-6-hydroxymethyldihydropteridine diphosphokinase [Bacillota bacterium]|nr:2-amino-4-hydroxy-6-hydroxymethyldihydropteridine diphosphokinase [Bacillota bacterium]
MRHEAYIALGTNIEPRVTYLKQALEKLTENQHIQIVKESSIYETPPVGYTNQGHFLNMVIAVKTSLSAIKLLDVCQRIEQQLGRKRDIRFGPRTIDLDILIYNEENIKTERLIVPHPRMHERAFVLIPLVEIAQHLRLPGEGMTMQRLLDDLPEKEKKDIVKWTMNGLADESKPFEN